MKYKSGIIDENILENIKNENSLYLSLKDIRKEEIEALEKKKEEYETLKDQNREILFLEKITTEEKNSFITNIIEEKALKEAAKKEKAQARALERAAAKAQAQE